MITYYSINVFTLLNPYHGGISSTEVHYSFKSKQLIHADDIVTNYRRQSAEYTQTIAKIIKKK